MKPLKVTLFPFIFGLFYYTDDVDEIISKIQAKNMKVGISVKPKTHLDDKVFELLDKNLIDNFLIMTVREIFHLENNFFLRLSLALEDNPLWKI